MGSRAAGLPSQRPGKQEEKVAKPPAGGEAERRASWGGPAGAGEPGHPPTTAAQPHPPGRPAQSASLWPEHLVSVLVLEGHSHRSGGVGRHIYITCPCANSSSHQSGAGLAEDAAVMPIKVRAHKNDGPCTRRAHRGAGSEATGVFLRGYHQPLHTVAWARLGLPASPPGLMQSLPASNWPGAPGQAWMPGPGGKGF